MFPVLCPVPGEGAMKNAVCLLVTCLVAIGLVGCAARRPDSGVRPDPGEDGVGGTQKPVQAARCFAASVDEHNLVLDDREAARDYLRRKLVALVAAKLIKVGFASGRAAEIAAGGELSAFHVHGHREKVFGKGERAGKLDRVELWDVHGRLQVELGGQHIDEVMGRLGHLPVTSLDGAEAMAGYLRALEGLDPDRDELAALWQKLADTWVHLLEPVLKIQLQVPVEPVEDYFTVLEEGAARLARFRDMCPDHPAFDRLEKLFTLAAIKALHTVEVSAANHQALDAVLAHLEALCRPALPGVMPYLMRDIELAWRDRLEKLDDSNTPFPEMKPDFVMFLERFPQSDFYPELELRFLARWTDYLAAREVEDPGGLRAYLDEVDLLAERFPSAGGLESVHRAAGIQCRQVLSSVEVPDLRAGNRMNELLERCRPWMPPGTQTEAVARRLAAIRADLVRRKDDREERAALRDLTFFIGWDRAIRALPWGRKLGERLRESWMGHNAFQRQWEKGRDAGSECRCSLDPDEPCRSFEEQGPHGGFEVVARFYRDQLAGVDVCQVYTGGNVEPLYRFYKRRYRAAHNQRRAAVFLAGGSRDPDARGVRFGKPDGIQVTLERSHDTVTVRYRHGTVLAQRERDEAATRERREQQRRKRREERIRAGWKPGDCVQWDCVDVLEGLDCAYSGNVLERKGDRYRIRVIEAEDDPAARGADLLVDQDHIVDCE